LEDRNIDVLAKSESLLANYYLNTPPRGFWRKLWSRLKSVQVSSTLIPADVKLELHPSEDRALMTHFHEVHANAWVKRYSTTHSDSGFFRIWDYGPRNVTGAQLEELYEIVKRICM
jgi:hypothetical protein